LREAFLSAVGSHLVSDVPIGAFLSGGVDSSAVVGAMARLGGAEVRTLTVTFPDAPDCSEGRQAAAWASACGATHQEVPITGGDLLALLPKALAAQDQPTADGVNTYVVSRAARDAGLTVALSGLGGDELFGGYPTFRDTPRSLQWRRVVGPLGRPLAASVRAFANGLHRRPAKIADLLSSPADMSGQYAARRRLFAPWQCARVFPAANACLEARSRPAVPVSGLHPLDAVSALDQAFYMRNLLLRDSDFMSMACSIEIRVPFLDTDFVEAAWAAGPAARDGKRFFVRALDGIVPADLAEQPKRGFTMPFQAWMAGPLRAAVEDRLRVLPAGINADVVLKLWREFLQRPDAVGWTRPWALFALATYLADNGLEI
jgi:asparagine synthase (glutamine-hydrolysing)